MSKHAGYIYAIQAEGTPYVKIGQTTGSVEKRLRSLQTGQPFPLTILAVVRIDIPPRVLEGQVHALLAPYRHQGEWFEMTLDAGQLEHVVSLAMTALRQQQEAQGDTPAPAPPKTLAQRLRALRQGVQWSQREVGERIGQDQAYISRLECGAYGITVETLEKFMDLFGVSADYLLGRKTKEDDEDSHAA
jgi:hypothetical protein